MKLRETLRSQAIRDPLTGLFNRRYLEVTMEREMNRVKRQDTPLGVIMMDLEKPPWSICPPRRPPSRSLELSLAFDFRFMPFPARLTASSATGFPVNCARAWSFHPFTFQDEIHLTFFTPTPI